MKRLVIIVLAIVAIACTKEMKMELLKDIKDSKIEIKDTSIKKSKITFNFKVISNGNEIKEKTIHYGKDSSCNISTIIKDSSIILDLIPSKYYFYLKVMSNKNTFKSKLDSFIIKDTIKKTIIPVTPIVPIVPPIVLPEILSLSVKTIKINDSIYKLIVYSKVINPKKSKKYTRTLELTCLDNKSFYSISDTTDSIIITKTLIPGKNYLLKGTLDTLIRKESFKLSFIPNVFKVKSLMYTKYSSQTYGSKYYWKNGQLVIEPSKNAYVLSVLPSYNINITITTDKNYKSFKAEIKGNSFFKNDTLLTGLILPFEKTKYFTYWQWFVKDCPSDPKAYVYAALSIDKSINKFKMVKYLGESDYTLIYDYQFEEYEVDNNLTIILTNTDLNDVVTTVSYSLDRTTGKIIKL